MIFNGDFENASNEFVMREPRVYPVIVSVIKAKGGGRNGGIDWLRTVAQLKLLITDQRNQIVDVRFSSFRTTGV